jgi:hypothetical protein
MLVRQKSFRNNKAMLYVGDYGEIERLCQKREVKNNHTVVFEPQHIGSDLSRITGFNLIPI